MKPTVSIVIPSHNEGPWLQRTVEAVGENTRFDSYEIIVVDDGSTDGSADFIAGSKSIADGLRLKRGRSLGVSGARTLGAQAARGRILVFLDAHVLPEPGWLQEIVALLEDPTVGVAGVGVSAVDSPGYLGHCYVPANANLNAAWATAPAAEVFDSPAIIGCCFGVRRQTFATMGGFDPGAVGWGVDDIEFGLRCWRLGYSCRVSRRRRVAHRFKNNENRSYQVSWQEYDVNLLRCALTLFEGQALAAILLNAAQRPSYQEALAQVQEDRSFWRRRASLQARFKRRQGWYFQRFSSELAPLLGQLNDIIAEERGRNQMEIQRNINCPNCGAKNLGVQATCLLCQTVLPTPPAALQARREGAPEAAAARCRDCGHQLQAGRSYCTNCGKPVSE